jgi:hypothetical protein
MPKKTISTDSAAAAPVRAAKPKTTRTSPVVEVASKPRVRTVKHSKAAAPVAESPAIVETMTLSAHDRIAKIAYGYWEARGFETGCPEQDWLRAEREFHLSA